MQLQLGVFFFFSSYFDGEMFQVELQEFASRQGRNWLYF